MHLVQIDTMAQKSEFVNQNPWFQVVLAEDKDKLIQNRKAKNMNRATKQWVDCFQVYLTERNLSQLDDIVNDNLAKIIGDFYFSLRKKQPKKTKEQNDDDTDELYYKNCSLKSGRAALNHHLKGMRGIDIISNETFIQANEIFKAVTRDGKIKGHGKTQSKLPIFEPDMSKLSSYFTTNM